MAKKTRYSLKTSNEYIYTWLSLELVFILGTFALIYFLVYKPRILTLPDFEFYSRLVWGIFTGVMFLIFALTFMIANSKRYWLDMEYIEVWNIYRPKKRKTILLENIVDIKIRRMPILSTALNFGTIIIYTSLDEKKPRIRLRIVGVKYPNDVYLDLLERGNLKKEVKELKPEELLK